AQRIRAVVSHIANAQPEYKHQYLVDRPVQRVGFIVVSTDRGLCGGLNINLFKATVQAMKTWADQGVGIDLCTIGGKAAGFFAGYGGNIVAAVRELGEDVRAAQLIGSVQVILKSFEEGRIDRLYLVSNEFINTMSQTPVVAQLLPLQADETQDKTHPWDYLYEPDARQLLDGL